MIEFLSLYLGLVTGMQPVEVIVGKEVARVEFFLDGESAGVLTSEPWRLTVDFGPRLLPRHLAAVAYDGDDGEIGRAEQYLNLPRPASEAGIVLERGEDDNVVAARVSWQSVAREQPLAVAASFDGEPVAVKDPRRIAIPGHNPRHFHIFVVELKFSERDRVQAVASFGGAYLSEVSTELTALPVTARRWPRLAELQGSVLKRGQPLRVVSIDKSNAELLFVRDIAAGSIIEEMGREGAGGVGGSAVGSATGLGEGRPNLSGAVATPEEQLRRMLTFESDGRIRLMWPATKRVERQEVRMDLFPASPPVTAAEGGVYWALTQTVILDGTSDVQRLTDAVAVAGLEAVADNRRRAVVLVLGSEPQDESGYEPGNVREFLRALGVPLYVWAVGTRKTVSAPAEWGEAETITSLRELQRAVGRLEKDLERQRILWVDGRHLPQELELAAGATVERVVR